MAMDDKLKEALRRCVGMARGFVVLDENLFELKESLEKYNLHVVLPKPGMSDPDIAKAYLGGRILITKNSKDFIEFAPVYDFGIIALENVKYIDTAKDISNQTSKLISKILVRGKLWSRLGAFLVKVKANGSFDIEKLD
jgi:hypothetical protein